MTAPRNPQTCSYIEPKTYIRHLLFETAASSIQISLNEDSTPKLSPQLSKNRQPRVLARIPPRFIFHTLLLFSYPTTMGYALHTAAEGETATERMGGGGESF